MMIIYMAVSVAGATITALLAGVYNPVLGLLAAPFGGSLLAAAAAFALAWHHSFSRQIRASSRETRGIPSGVVWC